jgi:hypothetical protein
LEVGTVLLAQFDVIGVAIGALCLVIAYGVRAILGARSRRLSLGAHAQAAVRPAPVAEAPPETPEPRELVRQWLDESQRMLEATRRERAEMAEAFDGVATRLLQLEQAAGAVAQGLRAKR